MKNLFGTLILVFLFAFQSTGQKFLEPADSLNKKRLITVSGTGGLAWAGSISALHFVWYKDFEKSKFHTFDDSREWNQMDKLGHMYTSWQFGRSIGDLYEWSGLDHKKSAIIGAAYSFGYMTTFELLDATNVKWGFSWSDVAFNTIGAGTYFAQEYLWNKQYAHFKFSFHDSELAQYRPNVLGSDFTSRLLKDYNGQTYWMSFNPIYWFKKESKVPEWLNLSLGYSTNNQLIGDGGTFVYTDGMNSTSFTPYRQYFLSFDINFEAIPTKSRFLKLVFRGLNFIKIPFPALELSQGKLGFRPFYF